MTARLRRIDGAGEGQIVTLSVLTRIGRASDNEIVIDDARISQVHATISWTAPGVWEIRDLGSSNGSFVDGVRLHPGERRTLAVSACVSFGDHAPQWQVIAAGRPLPEARDLVTGQRHLGNAQMLTLQVNDGTSVDIFEERRGRWVVEEASGVARDLRHGEVIEVGGRPYKVSLPIPVPETEEVAAVADASEGPLATASLTFYVSADLESVELRVEWSGRTWTCRKAYARALLALAEARVRDERAKKVSPHEQGWMYGDELCKVASYDGIARLNVEVHRARTEFARQGIPGAPAIVQRRRGTGQMRLGTNRVEVVHGIQHRGRT